MQDIQVKKQNFETLKNTLKSFSNNLPKTPLLVKFQEDNWIGLSKNVTGKEMNEFIVKLQKVFSETNATSIKIIKEFNDIYNVFEALDKEYIEYFEASINNLTIVNEKAQDAQKDVDSALKVLRGTIEKLNEFKKLSTSQLENIEYRLNTFDTYLDTKLEQFNQIEEIKASLEKYEHFMDIDKLWVDVQMHKDQIQNLINTSDNVLQDLVFVKNHIKRIEALNHIDDLDATWEQVQYHTTEIKSIIKNLHSLNSFKAKVDSITHLNNIDEMWNDLVKIKSDIPDIFSNLKEHSINIEELKLHKDQVSEIIHLKDVDQLWNENEVLKKEMIEVKKNHQEFERKSSDTILQLNEKNKMLEELIKSNEVKSNSKITYAYAIGGITFLLVIIQFVLNFSK
ncbi:hypothetical protein ACTS91_10215 [Empedobacter falsenii]